MKRQILAVHPSRRDAVEAALGELLGEGWGPGCLTPYPQPASPADPPPAPTVYVCDVHLDDDQAAKLEGLAASETSITLAKALAVGERAPQEPRKTLREVLVEHADKAVRIDDVDTKGRG